MPNIELFKVCRASAGSGKTFTVAMKSIAQMMLRHGKTTKAGLNVHRHLLAVTFTNDATAEMKNRILAELWTLANNTDKSKILTQMRSKQGLNRFNDWSNEEVSEVANVILTDMLHDYSNLHILTIDSFLQQLLRQLAHELGVGSRFNIELDAKAASEEATRCYVAKAEVDSKVKDQLVDFLTQRLEDEKSWDIKQDLTKFAQELFKENFQSNSTSLERVDEALFEQVRKECYKREKQVFKDIQEKASALKTQMSTEGVSKDIANFYGKMDNLDKLTDYDTLFGKTVNASLETDGHIMTKDFRDNANEALLLPLHQTFCQWLKAEALPELYTMRAIRAHLTELKLLTELSKTLHQNLNEQGRFMLSDTAFLLSNMIVKDDVSFLFERLDAQIDNVLIDEAQDTSKLQWKIFRNFVAEKLSAGNFGMLVGDVKQSIYRWRNSDWRILNDIDTDPTLSLNPKDNIQNLRNNFRSYRHVVECNNRLFSHLKDHFANFYRNHYDPSATTTAIEKAYNDNDTPQTPQKEEEGSVHYCFIDSKEEHAKAVVDKLLELRNAGIKPNDIAILIRKHRETSAIVSYAQQLQASGFDGENEGYAPLFHEGYLNFITDKAFELQSNRLLQLVVTALHMVKSPKEEIYRAQVLMLHKMINNEADYQLPTSAAEREQCLPESLKRPDLYKLQRAPLLDVVYAIIDAFKLNTYTAHAAYLFTFLNEVTQFADTNTATVANFLDYWNHVLCTKSLTSGTKANGVRITTIHKSKGLEYHTVIVPFVTTSLNVDSGGLLADTNWFVPIETSNPAKASEQEKLFMGFPVLPVVTNKTLVHSHLRPQMLQEVEMGLMDILNVTYVAFTRAKCNLVVIANRPAIEKKAKKRLGQLNLDDAKLADAIYTFAASQKDFQESDNDSEGKTFSLGTLVPSKSEEKPQEVPQEKPQEEPQEKAKEDQKEDQKDYSPFESDAVETVSMPFPLFKQPNAAKIVKSNRAKRFFEEMRDHENTNHSQEAIERGLLLHSLYERIATANDIDHAVESLLVEGQIATRKEAQSLANEVRQHLAIEPFKSWFSSQWQLFNECGIVTKDKEGNVGERRPDRVMTNGEETIVVDYKFGQPVKHHHRQVADYMDFLVQMGFKNVKGYLWYVTLNQIEEVKQP